MHLPGHCSFFIIVRYCYSVDNAMSNSYHTLHTNTVMTTSVTTMQIFMEKQTLKAIKSHFKRSYDTRDNLISKFNSPKARLINFI